MPRESNHRLLVFIVAYQAEDTLEWVLDRIPESVYVDFECEVLVVDDGSHDDTFSVGNRYRLKNPELPITVMRNEFNQGYGGNQKIGYLYAIEQGFDFVALIHGDGQYAPEELPRLLKPLVDHEAEAVFGSRMMGGADALRGGMPLYKYFGNRILTYVENKLLDADLSEFHSGYRIYSVKALERIPFNLNTNDFHFDTEIIIQLLNAGSRIKELPIPTYYGDEICRVNGIAYAFNVVQCVIRNRAHRSGIFYDRRFDPIETGNTHYSLKLGYSSSHTLALDTVPAGARVLDLGGGSGSFSRRLVEKGCEVCLVDAYASKEQIDGLIVRVQDIEEPLDVPVADFDHIVLLDVIEHMGEPEVFLDNLRSRFDHRPKTLILTTPNVAFVVQRLMLLIGRFEYGRRGILDLTHKRLFTSRSLKRLLRNAGFVVTEFKGVPAPFPLVFGDGWIGKLLVRMNALLILLSKGLFSYQFFVRAEGYPDAEFLLREAMRSRVDHEESR